MKKFWILSAGLVTLSGSMFADTIGSGTGSLVAVPTTSTFTAAQVVYAPATPANPNNTQTPFWNNPSGDNVNNHYANVGQILAGNTGVGNVIGGNLVAGNINGSYYAGSAGNGDQVTTTTSSFSTLTENGTVQGSNINATPALEFSFQSQATAYNIALLFADSQNNTGCVAGTSCTSSTAIGTTFGTYTETATNSGNFTFTALSTPTNLTSGGPTSIAPNDVLAPNTNFYGFYATVCYSQSAGVCTSSVTYTTGAGNFTTNLSSAYNGGLGWNHFALFELNGEEVLGFEDSPWLPSPSDTNSVEGIGDFNDIVIGLSYSSAAPEPGTIAIMGLGLAGLGLLGRRRFGKK